MPDKNGQKKFLAYFPKKSQTEVEIDGIQIIHVLSSTKENVTSAVLALLKMRCKSHMSALRNMSKIFPKRLK